MAIAFDAAAAAAAFGTTTATWSHTCTGSNLVLWVAGYIVEGDNLVSITYNAVGLTAAGVGKLNRGDGRFIYLYYMINPPTGAHNVVVTGAAGNTVHGASSSYTGAKQSGVPDTSGTSQGSGDRTVTLTTVADNCWIVGVCAMNSGSPQDGTNTKFRQGFTGSGPDGGLLDTNAAQTPAGSHSIISDSTASPTSNGLLAASFAPVGAQVNSNFLVFM